MAATNATEVLYEEGPITCIAVAAVTANRFVKITGAHVSTPGVGVLTGVSLAGAGDAVFGVAMFDAAIGATVSVSLISDGGVFTIIAGTGGITAGQEVQSDAAGGAIVLAAGKTAGMCINTVAAGGTAEIAVGR